MVMASWSWGMTVPPLSSALKPAIRSCGQSERFNSVRFLTLPASRSGWPGVSRDWGPLRYTWEHHTEAPREIRDEVGFHQAIRPALIKSPPTGGKTPAERELAI